MNSTLACYLLSLVLKCNFVTRLMVPVCSQSDAIPLMDDAFIKICSMVNDSSMKVRAKAVGLLGSLHNVSVGLLEQTLDKKLMSSGKVCLIQMFISS